jgi:nitrite reductase (NAD(P)H)
VLAFEVKEENNDIFVRLPPPDELDALIGSSKWMVRKATAEAMGRNSATSIEIVGPSGSADEDKAAASNDCGSGDHHGEGGGGCGSNKLEW